MTKKTIFLLSILSLFILINFNFVLLCNAADEGPISSEALDTSKPVTLDNPLGKTTTPEVLMGNIIQAILGIVGSIALVMVIYGGFIWMTAAGNQEKVTKGRDVLVWAAVGLFIIFSSYALVKFVFTGLGVS